MFTNKTLLITGGTGSFGNAVLDRFLNTDIKEIRIFSRDEKKQDDMRRLYRSDKIKYYIGDVRDYSGIASACAAVDYIFHAAALKQVPSCEFYPMEAVKTNIIGTENVLKAGIANEVKKIVVLSTDKAAYPVNAMGMSKAMMEKVMIAKSRNIPGDKTILCGTRYGNVMASRGSVIPLFVEQYKKGIPLTVTDPSMTRFLMSLEEAVELVLYAFEHGKQGDMFVQKAPACTIGDLAVAVKQLLEGDGSLQLSEGDGSLLDHRSHFTAELLVRHNIKIIGTRHGEKLYETLLTREEMVRVQEMGNYYRVPADNRDLNYEQYFEKGMPEVAKLQEYNSHNTERLSIPQIQDKLMQLEYMREVLASLKEWEGDLDGDKN
jgi:UDP-N-acetylglucosamine 4,6-dehydratase/5-epimerase